MIPRLLGLGTARPARDLPQHHAAAMAVRRCAGTTQHARVLPPLYQRTTVERRGSVLLDHAGDRPIDHTSLDWYYPTSDNGGRGPTTADRMARYAAHATPLALDACRRALDDARVGPDRITHLVTVTCTGFAAPGVEHQLIEQLGLSPDVQRTQVGFMGCHGAMNGLQVARAFAADPRACVLMVCVELCTLHFQYGWDSQRVVANALFADGAAAGVVASRPDADLQNPNGPQQAADTQPAAAPWAMGDTASRLFADSRELMSWHIGDHGFVMSLSPRVPQLIREHLRPWIRTWLSRHDLAIEDVGSFAIHPGGPRVVAAAAEALGLADADVADSREVLRQHGNMSSATILFILQRLRDRRCAMPCLALSFGPGLVGEAVLFTHAE